MDLRSLHVHLNVFMMFYGSCVDETFLFPFIEGPLIKTVAVLAMLESDWLRTLYWNYCPIR